MKDEMSQLKNKKTKIRDIKKIERQNVSINIKIKELKS